MTQEQQKALIALLKEARSIIRASSSRQLAKARQEVLRAVNAARARLEGKP